MKGDTQCGGGRIWGIEMDYSGCQPVSGLHPLGEGVTEI